MKAKSRIPVPGSNIGRGNASNPGSPAPGRPQQQQAQPSSSILDFAPNNNGGMRTPPPPSFQRASGSYAPSDAASERGDEERGSAGLDFDRMSVGSAYKGPDRPPTPTAEPKGSKAQRSNVLVAVRLRPLSDKERARGDHEAWMLDEHNNIGHFGKDGSFIPKHRYDTVFGKQANNLEVHDRVARPLVSPSLSGISGTVFAYGVTSSGKTHTMMGGYSETNGAEPGIVPNVVRELFQEIEQIRMQQQASGGPYIKQFSVRLSMMEIYNEVINDLLQPGQVNLKLMEVGGRGLVVDGLSEEPVRSAEDALELIAQGDAYRKVSSTAYNEDSSRSHTICRLHIDSMEVPASGSSPQQILVPRLPQQGGGRKTTAVLSLIDLAGSESAKVNQSKGQRMEGSFINKSLLTLGTVIHKLADARGNNQSHVPYRDSKLTRLLQTSMSGSGARISIVCNITPAAAQFEETGNTLKFATRAKLVQVAVSANDVMDDRTLVRRYRQEAAELRKQLTALLAMQNSGQHLQPNQIQQIGNKPDGGSESGQERARRDSEAEGSVYGGNDVVILELESELMDLRFQLEQERKLRAKVEQEKKMMETRLRRLTSLLLEKHNRAGSLFPSPAPNAPPSMQQKPLTPQQEEEVLAQWRRAVLQDEKNAAAAAVATQQQQEQQQESGAASASAERPPTPPQNPSVHSAGKVDATSPSSPGVRNGRFIRPSPKPSKYSQQSETLAEGEQPDERSEMDMNDEEAELLAQIQELHGTLASSKRQEGNDPSVQGSCAPMSEVASSQEQPQQQLQQPWDGSRSGQETGTHTPVRTSTGGKLAGSLQGDSEKDLEIQLLLADRDVLQDQIATVEMSNQRLVNSNEQLQAEVAWYKLETEKERRIVRELESDMVELRRFKNQTQAQLEALKAEAAEARNRRSAGMASPQLRPPSAPHSPLYPQHPASQPLPSTSPSPPPHHFVHSSSASFSSANGVFDASEFGELRAHVASGNVALPEVQARLEALEKHVLAAVASVIARNKQLETSLTQANQHNQHLQGYGLESMSAAQRMRLASSLTQSASRLSHGLNKPSNPTTAPPSTPPPHPTPTPNKDTPPHPSQNHNQQGLTLLSVPPFSPTSNPHSPLPSASPPPMHTPTPQNNSSAHSTSGGGVSTSGGSASAVGVSGVSGGGGTSGGASAAPTPQRMSMQELLAAQEREKAGGGAAPRDESVLVEWDLLGADEEGVEGEESEGGVAEEAARS